MNEATLKMENDLWILSFRLCKISFVKTLPQIDKSRKTPRFVYWYSPDEMEGATGDGQVWAWYPGSSYYVPLQSVSYHNGVPEGTE